MEGGEEREGGREGGSFICAYRSRSISCTRSRRTASFLFLSQGG